MADRDVSNSPAPLRMKNRKRALPPVEMLLAEASRLFLYDHKSGNLIRIGHANPIRPGQGKIGEVVGGDDGHGYRTCAVLGHKFKVHQVVWLLLNKEIPSFPIDHINRNRRDSRIENLRLATDQQNHSNATKLLNENCGVFKPKKGTQFISRIQRDGKKLYLGGFKTKAAAREAYVAASRKHRGEFSSI